MPFEEDDKDPSIWFLDHSYLENMFRMFKKVNGASRVRRACAGSFVWRHQRLKRAHAGAR